MLVLLALLLPGQALAHATLLRASPPVGSTVSEPPAQVVLHFNNPVDAANSTIIVADAKGRVVSDGAAAAQAEDTLAVPVVLPGPGAYKVAWSAATADGHITRGSFSFTVR